MTMTSRPLLSAATWAASRARLSAVGILDRVDDSVVIGVLLTPEATVPSPSKGAFRRFCTAAQHLPRHINRFRGYQESVKEEEGKMNREMSFKLRSICNLEYQLDGTEAWWSVARISGIGGFLQAFSQFL